MLKDEFDNFSICKVKPRVGLKLDNAINTTSNAIHSGQFRVVISVDTSTCISMLPGSMPGHRGCVMLRYSIHRSFRCRLCVACVYV